MIKPPISALDHSSLKHSGSQKDDFAKDKSEQLLKVENDSGLPQKLQSAQGLFKVPEQKVNASLSAQKSGQKLIDKISVSAEQQSASAATQSPPTPTMRLRLHDVILFLKK
jgi:hypothetical protein